MVAPIPYDPGTTDPFTESGYDIGDYVGVPQGYAGVPVGTRDYVAGGRFTGIAPPEVKYQQPLYTYENIASLSGNPQAIIAQQMKLYNTGYLTPDEDWHIGVLDEGTIGALQEFYGDANRMGMTTEQLYEYIRKNGKSTGMTTGSYGYGSGGAEDYSPYTQTTTQSNVTLSTRASARAFLVQAMATEMGREPTAQEVRRFTRMLNAREEKNPSVTKTTTTTDPSPSGDSTVTSDSTTKPSKVDPGRAAEKFAEKEGGNEAQRFQTANFMSVIEAMVGL